jgi:hypothetical protein
MKSQLKRLVIAIAFLGVVVGCVMAYRHCSNELKAFHGEWDMVSVRGPGVSGQWIFSTNGYVTVDGYRSSCFINPLLRTISWGDSARATYELKGNNLEILLPDDDDQDEEDREILWTLKKVRSY